MLTIDKATEGPWGRMGTLLQQAGQEDASGSRRYYVGLLARREYKNLCDALRITTEEAESLRAEFVAAWGEPEA